MIRKNDAHLHLLKVGSVTVAPRLQQGSNLAVMCRDTQELSRACGAGHRTTET